MSGDRLGDCAVANTCSGAVPLRYCRLIVTGASVEWARTGARAASAFATSLAGCGCEGAVERPVSAERTPDGRPGFAVLLFARDRAELSRQLLLRVGEGVLRCPTSAVFDGLPDAVERLELGTALAPSGGTFQIDVTIAGERFWRLPVISGEFLLADSFGIDDGVGAANLVVGAAGEAQALAAAEAAVSRMRGRGVALPAPGGLARSLGTGYGPGPGAAPGTGSLAARLAPTLRAEVADTLVPEPVGALFHIGFDAVSIETARNTLRRGLHAAAAAGAGYVTALDAGGAGGTSIALRELREAP